MSGLVPWANVSVTVAVPSAVLPSPVAYRNMVINDNQEFSTNCPFVMIPGYGFTCYAASAGALQTILVEFDFYEELIQ